MAEKDRRYYIKRRKSLHDERAAFFAHWEQLSENVQPRRTKFLSSDRNESRVNDKIHNSTPIRASRVLASGMMAGASNRSRPWFRVTTPDPRLSEVGPVREWCYEVEQLLRMAFLRSNVYDALHNVYEDLSWAGTGAFLLESDDETIMRAYYYPVGQYAVATNARNKIDTFYVDITMTVEQVVEKFGYEACSRRVKTHYDRDEFDVSIEVLLAIEPNRNRDPSKLGPRGMAYEAVWLERDGKNNEGVLERSGYREFPVMVPRWSVLGGDDYGIAPAMDALGDCKALQLLERRRLQAFSKVTNPPMLVPSTFLGRDESFLPGDLIYVDGTANGQEIKPAITIHPQVMGEFRQAIPDFEARIGQMFYADLWLDLIDTDRREITATEVTQRHEEKLLQLGPVMERLEDELLNVLISRGFSILLARGFIPPPPPELDGQNLRVEYISILAQAQKLLGTNSLERLSGFTIQLAQISPEVLDKVDFDEMLHLYADSLGAPPRVTRTPEAVAEIRAQRAQQEAERQEAEYMQAAAQGAKNLSGDIGDNSTLERLIQGYGGRM